MPYRHLVVLALLGFLAAVACNPAPPSPTSERESSPPAVIGLQPYFRGLRTARVESAAGTLTMLVDTGGGVTLVVHAIAERLGCTVTGRDVGHRMTGETVVFQRCSHARLRAGGLDVALSPLAVFDVNALLPPELPRVDGVLALDVFRGHVVTFDWPANEIRVHGVTTGGVNSLPVRFATGNSGRFFSPLVPVRGTAGALWFLLDSGNLRGTLVDRHVLEERLLDVDRDNRGSLAIDGRPERQVRFEPANLIIDGALGVDMLLEGPVTLDLRRHAELEGARD